MLRGTNLEHARVHNLRTVLETIRQHGPLSRAEIARRSVLTPQTISNLVHHLLDVGLVLEAGQRRGSRGRASTDLTINGEGAYFVGLDLDRGHLTGLLVDLAGEVKERVHLDTTFPSPERAIELMVRVVGELTAVVDANRVWGVGVGFPGPLRIVDGVVDNVINPDGFPGWENVSVAEKLANAIDHAVFLENNATAAAVGEGVYGVGRELDSFFYVFLGVGLGGGIVRGGAPLRGWQGNAGEIGYLPGSSDYGSGDYLGRYFDVYRLYERLELRGTPAASFEDLSAMLAAGDELIREWLDTAADRLAPWLLAAQYLIDPQALVIGGAWPPDLKLYLSDKLASKLASSRSKFITYSPSLLQAALGRDAAALGVATLPLYQLLSPFPTAVSGNEARTPAEHPLVLGGR